MFWHNLSAPQINIINLKLQTRDAPSKKNASNNSDTYS